VDEQLAVAWVRFLACPPPLRCTVPRLAELDDDARQELIAYCEARGLALSAYQYCLAEGRIPLASAAAAHLQRLYARSHLAGQWMARELERLCLAFAEAGIEVVVLKGLHLATLLWPDPALRPFGDLDLWVRPEAVSAADTLLRTLGYGGGPADPGAPLDPLNHELPAYRLEAQGKPVFGTVDLHYRLAPSTLPLPDEAAIFARTIPWRWGARVLAPTDLLVYATDHAARHLFVEVRPGQFFRSGYGYLGEIARLIVQLEGDIDWQLGGALFAAAAHRRALLLPLRLAAQLWPLRLPPAIERLWRGDLLGTAILKTMLGRLDQPWQRSEGSTYTFWNYSLPYHLTRLTRTLRRS
jgi:hypothetical protein